ncbi:MAG: hypothetical protein FJX76_13175 [Armatimonadetes bacterium]|nr:hypothetical protein [Armatimonadota bacterium]
MQGFTPGLSQIPNTAPQTGAATGAMGRGPTPQQPPAKGQVPAQPGTLLLQSARNLPLQPGMQLRGQVLARQGDTLTLQFGRNQMTATTALPLAPGEHVEVQVQGQQQGGKWSLQVTGSQLFTAMSDHDVQSSLMSLKLPVGEGNVALAKAMVEQNVPLGKESFQELKQTLQQLPRPATPQDAQAATFLKAGNLPVTPQNVTVLANFITEHPLLGAQLFTTQNVFRRLVESTDGRLPRELADLLSEVPGLLGELVIEPKQQDRQQTRRRMRNAAFQAGIEHMGPHLGDDFDYLEWLKSLQQRLKSEAALPELALAGAQLEEVADNLRAQRLMNTAASDEQGAFYLQLPLRDREKTAELRLIYHRDTDGRPRVEAPNAELELSVPTTFLGDVGYSVTVRDGRMAIDVAVDCDEKAAFVERYLPVLVDNLERIGYHVQSLACRSRGLDEGNLRTLVDVPYESMERVNISA